MPSSLSSPSIEQRLAARAEVIHAPVMFQNWRRLLFLHWAWDPDEIQRTLPAGLTVDTFNDKAYLGVVPFYMEKVRPAFFPAIPRFSNFLELNVRTYVYDAHGRAGVWFYSLDCNRALAVSCARMFFLLPYYHARMKSTGSPALESYSCQRRDHAKPSSGQFVWRPSENIGVAEPGTLEFFLIERYALFAYSKRKQKLYCGRVFHHPYLLRKVELLSFDSSLLDKNGFPTAGRPPDHIIGSDGAEVRVGWLS